VEADGQERPAWTLVSGQAQAGGLLLAGLFRPSAVTEGTAQRREDWPINP